jgi:hypothetical protein
MAAKRVQIKEVKEPSRPKKKQPKVAEWPPKTYEDHEDYWND